MNITQFHISSRRGRQKDTQVINKRIPRKFFRNNFALLDEDNNTSGPLYRGGIADLLLLRTLLTILQFSSKSSYWE